MVLGNKAKRFQMIYIVITNRTILYNGRICNKDLIQILDRILAKTCISIVQNEFGKN